ncbi:MAG: peptidoglycan-binding protein [Bacteroidota bacterium]|nr:peptidoglycan-binding protein [Bacteroidota bacterium]
MADIVLFDWEGDGKCNHTGIFHEWVDATKKMFWSYEGNTSNADNSNGGMVMRRKRYVTTVIAFVKPKVLSGESVSSTPSEIMRKGNTGAGVAKLQKQLYDLKYKITVDGDFGNETEKIIKQFQKDNKLQITGEVTPGLLGFIETKLSKPPVVEEKLTTGSFLKKGNSGQMVVLLQKTLNKKGANPKLEEDGVFGDATVKAVKDYQTKNKLKIDGIAGPQTLSALGVK